MLGKGLHIFFDDLLITSETLKEHYKLLREVFRRLREHNLKLAIEKCEFLKHEMKYMSHVISEEGCKPDPGKTAYLLSSTKFILKKQIKI